MILEPIWITLTDSLVPRIDNSSLFLGFLLFHMELLVGTLIPYAPSCRITPNLSWLGKNRSGDEGLARHLAKTGTLGEGITSNIQRGQMSSEDGYGNSKQEVSPL